ncbi:MAG TPA: efflux transporter outer membrane subunit [Geobacteraceae bacterium]|nr:efflux transporter outer membrane subunit [Geobacteraceae bacterium]
MLAATAAWLIAGCAAGPDFHRPSPPGAKGYTETPLPSETTSAPSIGGDAQRFIPGRDVPAQWWTLFKSKSLDSLIRQALADSPTLAASQAALRQARENRLAQLGALFPAVDADFSANRSQFTGASFGQPNRQGGLFTLYNASVNISYTLDLFGATRRGLEELQAQVDYQRYLLEGSYLTLASNIVTTAIQEGSLRSQVRATKEILKAQEEQLALVEQQFQLGGASRADVLAQRAQLDQTRATLPPLEKQLSQTRHQLAVLSGKPPGDAAALPEFELADLTLLRELPVSIPSDLVRQRPDILAAEEQLHAACALIGVATANMLPKLTISGNYGSQAMAIGDLFTGGTGIWSIGAGLVQPLFRGGELTAKRRAAIAAYDQAEAQYRQTVLVAFQNVADVLRALEQDAVALKAQADAEKSAADSLEIARNQYELGAVSYLTLLNAERQHQQARLTLAQAQAARFADTAALFQALGGGWWNKGKQAEGK